jgi:hypothetical protein
MRVISHLKYNKIPDHDNLYYWYDWSTFQSDNDAILKDVDFHIIGGISIDESRLDKTKINVGWAIEYPNGFWSGRRKGENYKKLIHLQSLFDVIFCQCRQTCEYFGKKFVYYANPVDYSKIYKNLSIDNIDNIKKDIDVFMCANSVGPNIRGTSIPCPIYNWNNIIRNYNHKFCNASQNLTPWKEKQNYSMRSKISIVWADFLHLTEKCKNFCDNQLPWYKFKKLKIDNNKSINVIPHPKMRIYDAAMSKSIILCAKTPFYGCEKPYTSALEEIGLVENEDFIFFEDCVDLDKKISKIISEYDNVFYKNMVESAHKKINEKYNLENF